MIILGIDPGTARVGYGAITKDASGLRLLRSGLLRIRSGDPHTRLLELAQSFTALLRAVRPHCVALEKIYFSKNQTTGIAVAEARGILTLLILQHKIPLLEFTPLEMKRGLTGYGLASKRAVMLTVARLLHMKQLRGGDDAADALALAIVAAGNTRLRMRVADLQAKRS